MGSKTFLINKIWEVREKKKTQNKHFQRTLKSSYNSAFFSLLHNLRHYIYFEKLILMISTMWVEKITSLFLTHSARQPCTNPFVHEIIIKWCWTKRNCTMHFKDDVEVTPPKYKSNLGCFGVYFQRCSLVYTF